MLYGLVHNGINFVLGDVLDFFGAAVQERFELRNDSGFTFGWGNLLRWNGCFGLERRWHPILRVPARCPH